MAVLDYVNGAWQDASETPKKYVNGVWEDSDGYTYENGAWESKWDGKIYLIKDGVINPKLSYTRSIDSGTSNNVTNWTYVEANGYIYGTCNKSKNGSRITLSLNLNSGISLTGKNKMYVKARMSNVTAGHYTRSGYIRVKDGSTTNGIIFTDKTTTQTLDITINGTPSLPVECILTADGDSGYACTASLYIYDIWFE